MREYRYPAKSPAPTPVTTRKSGDDIAGLIVAWQRSPEWRKYAERSKERHATYLRRLRPIDHIRVSDIKRQHLLELRDGIATSRGDGAAGGFIATVSTLLSWAKERGIIEHNPIVGGAKGLHRGSLPAWTAEEAETAMRDLPEPLRRAVVLALYTAQRRGDLCALRWSQYDGQSIRLTQEKTHTPVVIPCHPRLKAELDTWAANRTAVTILTDAAGRPWRWHCTLSALLPKALQRIGVRSGLNCHGLRKLACTMLAEAGASTHEIAAISGHKTLGMVALYTASVNQERLAQSAMARLTDQGKKLRG